MFVDSANRYSEGMSMRARVVAMLATIAALAAGTLPDGIVAAPGPPPGTTIAYASHGRLWLRSPGAGQPRLVRTPFGAAGLLWSPDGQRLLVADDQGRLAVVDPSRSGWHVLSRGNWKDRCAVPALAVWSPDSRSLAYLTCRARDTVDLWLWDRSTSRRRRLYQNLGEAAGAGAWSHDSRYLAFPAGGKPYSIDRVVNPSIRVAAIHGGGSWAVGRGLAPSWSPDGRWIAYLRVYTCGATQCFNDQLIVPSHGGHSRLLARDLSDFLIDNEWVRTAEGYAYDRWILSRSGRVVRRIISSTAMEDGERVDAWSPDGRYAAVQSMNEYESKPVVLSLVSSTGKRTFLHATPRPDSCGACTRVSYDVQWTRDSHGLAIIAPAVLYPNSTTGSRPELSVYRVGAGAPARLRLPPGHEPELIGLAGRDRNLFVQSGSTLYLYRLPAGQPVRVVSGLRSPDDVMVPALPIVGIQPGT